MAGFIFNVVFLLLLFAFSFWFLIFMWEFVSNLRSEERSRRPFKCFCGHFRLPAANSYKDDSSFRHDPTLCQPLRETINN